VTTPAAAMTSGSARRAPIADVRELAAVIERLDRSEALALGALRADLPDQLKVVTKDKLKGAAGVIARTGTNIVYTSGRSAFVLLDLDFKGMPSEVADRLTALGGFWEALVAVLPALRDVGRVVRRSTSSGLRHTDTGEILDGSGGIHIFITAQDGDDVERFLTTLHERCWLSGYGWIMVGRAGQLLERSIIDRSVGAPERLVFEAPPILTPPLAQDAESRRPIATDGEILDTLAACPPLTEAERATFDELVVEAKARIKPEADQVRAAYIDQRADELVKRTGMSRDAAVRVIESQCRGVLLPDVELFFVDKELKGTTVGDVLDDPGRFDGFVLADPIEGISYGRTTAMVMRRRDDGRPWIKSFAHGGVSYSLERAEVEPTSGYIDRLNERHAVVRVGAKTVILDEQPGHPPQFMTTEDFHLWYANNQIAVSRNKTVAVSRLWIADPRRRQYTRAVFDPTDHDPNHFNLWRGFAVKPDPNKSCKKFLAHLRDNICSGVEEHYQWTMGLFAHMVQRPQEKPGIALVLRGKEGTGKGFLARWLGQICPQHYVVVSQATHITGRFNAHLQQALLVFVDEAFWAGDKAGEGALKHLVTDKDQLIEPKHVTAYMVQSLMRSIIASNEHWVVPAGLEARRWAVFDVADTHKNDRKYFGDINVEMKNGGLEALMHILTTFDLSKVDVFTAPKTAALLDQKTESLPPHERWWLETLQEGYIKYLEYSQYIGETDEWLEKIEKDKIWSSYRSWVHLHNVRSRLWPDKQLHRWIKDANLLPGSKTYRPRGTDDRKRMLTLPALGDCRKAYEAHIGQSVEWHDEEPPQPPPDEELPF
jgi:uncharacterized protein DUF5906